MEPPPSAANQHQNENQERLNQTTTTMANPGEHGARS